MIYLTISSVGVPDPQRTAAIEGVVARHGGETTWRRNAAANRSYASIASPNEIGALEIPAEPGDVVYEMAIIALAVFPEVAEALPQLAEALGGEGRPAGILACRPIAGGIIVEWNPEVCGAELVLGLIDAELRRYRSGRTAAVLSALPPPVLAAVAARGLQAPEVTTQRILDLIVAP